MSGWAWLGSFVGAAAAVILWRWARGRREPGYLAVCEYWVYAPAGKTPRIEALMEAMVRSNPHSRPHRPAITTREGVLFSDLRLRLSHAVRDKNPHAFRPDLSASDLVPTAETLAALAEARVFVRCRYLSEVRLADHRHLQFMPHLAAAVARLNGANLVYDVVQQTMDTTARFAARLDDPGGAERPEFHVRTVWFEGPEGPWAETRGLRKLGRRELRTDYQEADSRILVEALLESAVRRLWEEPSLTGKLEETAFGSQFLLELVQGRGETQLLKLSRIRAV